MVDTAVPPHDRFCDLVMKGGITSGVVYPRAIFQLAQHYRLKNIGGSSAGAIAAAAAAAAEYRRRYVAGGSALPQPANPGYAAPENVPVPDPALVLPNGVPAELGGFHELAQLPGQLGQQVSCRKSKLLSLFQPSPSCRRLFTALVTSLNWKSTATRAFGIVLGLMRAYVVATLLSIAVFSLVWRCTNGFTAALALVLMLTASIGLWVYWDITHGLVRNNFGLCTGMTQGRNTHQALTPWLHGLIQRIAGRRADEAPLTFGELWSAPGFPSWVQVPATSTRRSIDLQMFTTNLSHGRPYLLPLTDSETSRERLFFIADELTLYLPDAVMHWMKTHARSYAPNPASPESDPPLADAQALGLAELPAAQDFPVLLAARMSLSFPLLFSAVPLWAIDYDKERGQRTFRRCWFSDGGIASNFPVHLFDGLLPMWPTFGIQLEPPYPGREMIFLPKRYLEGSGELWSKFGDLPKLASRMGGFISAIVGTMQNWNDNTLSRMPGVRDRVIRVRLKDNEGGLNLNMEEAQIQCVAQRGEDAAKALCEQFSPAAPGWDGQRWIRLGVVLSMLHRRFYGVAMALSPDGKHATAYDDLIETGKTKQLSGEDAVLTAAQHDALKTMIEALRALNKVLDPHSVTYAFKPVPEPDLRVRPSL